MINSNFVYSLIGYNNSFVYSLLECTRNLYFYIIYIVVCKSPNKRFYLRFNHSDNCDHYVDSCDRPWHAMCVLAVVLLPFHAPSLAWDRVFTVYCDFYTLPGVADNCALQGLVNPHIVAIDLWTHPVTITNNRLLTLWSALLSLNI